MEVKAVDACAIFRAFTAVGKDPKTLILDVRAQKDYKKGHINQAFNPRLATNGKFLADYSQAQYSMPWSQDCWWAKPVIVYGPASLAKDHPVIRFLAEQQRCASVSYYKQGYEAFAAKYPYLCTTSVKANSYKKYPSLILPGTLYLGDWADAEQQERLQELSIKRIVSVHNHPERLKVAAGVKHMKIELPDIGSADISSHFNSVYEFLAEAERLHQPALVHCGAGVSRSACLVMMYLMRSKRWSAQQAREHCIAARSLVCPNDGFWQVLCALEGPLGILNRSDPNDTMGFAGADAPAAQLNAEAAGLPVQVRMLTAKEVKMAQNAAEKAAALAAAAAAEAEAKQQQQQHQEQQAAVPQADSQAQQTQRERAGHKRSRSRSRDGSSSSNSGSSSSGSSSSSSSGSDSTSSDTSSDSSDSKGAKPKLRRGTTALEDKHRQQQQQQQQGLRRGRGSRSRSRSRERRRSRSGGRGRQAAQRSTHGVRNGAAARKRSRSRSRSPQKRRRHSRSRSRSRDRGGRRCERAGGRHERPDRAAALADDRAHDVLAADAYAGVEAAAAAAAAAAEGLPEPVQQSGWLVKLEVFKPEGMVGHLLLGPLNVHQRVVVGRAPACNVVLEHLSISRQHAQLTVDLSGTVLLMDLGSQHGTKLNDAWIKSQQQRTMAVGSVVQFGASTRRYKLLEVQKF